jgi:CAAX protease family protein
VVSKQLQSWRDEYPSLGYLAPFVCVLLFLLAPKPQTLVYWEWPIQVFVVALVCVLTWPRDASLRPHHWLLSIVVGVVTLLLWIGPEVIYPKYREFFLFSNGIVGHVGSSLRAEALKSNSVLFWRTVRAATVVPIAEELFWRAWLMRWLVNNDFQKVPLGKYVPMAFWVTALLFGAEHGPYWDVGLLTGVIYNFWMVRTKSLGDCILVHAVTNLLMSLYVIRFEQWQYWQ